MTMEKMTAEQIREICKTWEGRQESIDSLTNAKDLPDWMKKDPKVQELGVAGCWLAERIVKDLGGTKKQAEDTQFVLGQYAVFGDVYKHTARIYNEYVDGAKPQAPGDTLADAILGVTMEVVTDGVKLTPLDHRVGK